MNSIFQRAIDALEEIADDINNNQAIGGRRMMSKGREANTQAVETTIEKVNIFYLLYFHFLSYTFTFLSSFLFVARR